MTTYEVTNGSIAHVEFYTDDPGATRRFFETVFGWTFEEDEAFDYTMWRPPDPPYGGLMAREAAAEAMPGTLVYVVVDDLAATRDAVVEAGGEVIEDEVEVPDMGVFTVFRDPGGVVEAAWEDHAGESADEWATFTDEPAVGSVVHVELYSDDPLATARFHETAFGWTFETEDDYLMAAPPTPPYGGVMPTTEGMPAGTLAYVLVDDAAQATRAVARAGGRVRREPFVVGDWGRMALFEAPGGVVGAVWEPADADRATSPSAASERAGS